MNQLTRKGCSDYRDILVDYGLKPMVVPAGEAFKIVFLDNDGGGARLAADGNRTRAAAVDPIPFRDLYFSAADGSHPSLSGTYLVACLFYGRLLKKAGLSGVTFQPEGLSAASGAWRLPAERCPACAHAAERCMSKAMRDEQAR